MLVSVQEKSVIGACSWLSARAGTWVFCLCASLCVNVKKSQCCTCVVVHRCVSLEGMCLCCDCIYVSVLGSQK